MFKVHELARITGAKIIRGQPDTLVRGISIDSRTITGGQAFLALKGDNFDGHDFLAQAAKNGAVCLIKEKGKGKRIPAGPPVLEVKNSVKALGQIAAFHRRRFTLPIIAVTGSNGKTTTKEMIAWVLSRRYNVLKTEGTRNNHIGLPLTLLGIKDSHTAAVVELGTNHFGEIGNLSAICRPNIGLITNIGPSHLEHFGNIEGVLKEKYSLAENLESPGIMVLNADDKLLRRKLDSLRDPRVRFGFGMNLRSDFRITHLARVKQGIEFKVNGSAALYLRTIGAHNVYNALAAAACARLLGLSYEEIRARLSDFDFPKGRLKLRKFDTAQFIDDTYNSSPASLKQALYALEDFPARGRKIMIMGDMMELGEDKEEMHYEAGKHIARVCDKLIAVGKLSKCAADAARHCGFDTGNIYSCSSSDEAREFLFGWIRPEKEDVVLVKGSRAMKMEKIFEAGGTQKAQPEER